ncbi:Programmed cell death protein 2 [Tupaia chinensis]|uniref:Programmed cell death protein 2 n=1 Tax=Tupaia chinensis TaxID=246437 RepID=L9L217_TUPCH|nr:Programmed cell death protein 2 [Tupaia chinensis]
MGGALEKELDSMAKQESREDKIFQKFKTRIALEPEQVVFVILLHVFTQMDNIERQVGSAAPIDSSQKTRFSDMAEGLPPSGFLVKISLKKIIFQIVPAVPREYLNSRSCLSCWADSLGRSVDWGTLAVFTCADSCSLGTGYTEEFVWKQDVTDVP